MLVGMELHIHPIGQVVRIYRHTLQIVCPIHQDTHLSIMGLAQR